MSVENNWQEEVGPDHFKTFCLPQNNNFDLALKLCQNRKSSWFIADKKPSLFIASVNQFLFDNEQLFVELY